MNESYLKACEENNYSLVRDLLSSGADVNWKSDEDDYYPGYTGLYWAAFHNSGDLLELLLTQTGVDVNITRSHQMTPLMTACRHGHENIVRRLCQVTDIQLNTINDHGWTALHYAVNYNKPACVSVLRGVAGVDWNVRDNNGDYPLTTAVERGRAECLQIILSVPEPHLDLTVTDYRGRNIAQIAVEEEFNYGGDRQRCLELLSRDRRMDPFWNIKNSDGDTPVMFCLKNNKIEMARCLINTPGVDLDTVDREGRYLETIARERDLNILSLVCRANTDNIASRIPECPVSLSHVRDIRLYYFITMLQVCYERFRGQSHVFQCEQGHFVCGSCGPRVHVRLHSKEILRVITLLSELSNLQRENDGQM